MIRNVLLDLDDTLLDFHRAEKEALSETLRRLDIPPEEAVLRRYSAINAAQWRLLEQGALRRDELKIRRYRLLFQELGLDRSPTEAAALYEELLSRGHYFIEGAPELLEALHGTWRLYLVTNGTTAVQRGRIRSAGIAPYFEELFLSEELGSHKPEVSFFQSCFARIPDFHAGETVIAGDSLSSDIQGGINAGIRTIWFNPRREPDPRPRPSFVIHALSELPALLLSLH